ncbi:MAG: TolC family protein [Planctomycetes bacterium]|nr:TolC family protein [Planctomycetota bacterium]
MKRWKNMLTATLLVASGLSGCKQPLYMTIDDHKAVTASGLLPADLDVNPNVIAPPTGEGHQKPATVDYPDRPIRYMTLAEAFAIALETGTRGSPAVFNALNGGSRAGFAYSDDLVSFQGRSVAGDDAIRAFALDPAIIGADIEGALSKFDARWITSMTWQKVDTATANVLNNFNNGDTAAFTSGIFKPLPTGGLAGITYNTNYTKLSNPPGGFQVINPSYQPAVTFSFEQPLLRDYGIEINQLNPAHPGSIRDNVRASGGRSEGILITRIRYEQMRAEFERTVNVMLFNVEQEYWALYASYFQLYAAEQGLRQAYLTWQLRKSELDAGKATAHEVAQVRAQFASFRSQRIIALQSVLETERQLRGILGIAVEDGKRIVPADAPTLAPFNPDWQSALTEALAHRPELLMAREEVKARQLDVMLQQNNTRPDLRFFANYNVNSIGTQLDGSGTNNALRNLSDNTFNNWAMGLRLDMPFGFRDANASLRASNLNLARSFIQLKNQELKTERFLTGVYQNLYSSYRQIEAAREQRYALAEQLRGLYARIQAGKDSLITILDAQQRFATALSSEHNAIANYNIALAGFQYAKGTLMQYNNVVIADGPLPNCTLARATEHERQRTQGIVARERAKLPGSDGPNPLPSLLEHQPPTPKEQDLPVELKAPTSSMPLEPMIPTRPTTGIESKPLEKSISPTGRPIALPISRTPEPLR